MLKTKIDCVSSSLRVLERAWIEALEAKVSSQVSPELCAVRKVRETGEPAAQGPLQPRGPCSLGASLLGALGSWSSCVLTSVLWFGLRVSLASQCVLKPRLTSGWGSPDHREKSWEVNLEVGVRWRTGREESKLCRWSSQPKEFPPSLHPLMPLPLSPSPLSLSTHS